MTELIQVIVNGPPDAMPAIVEHVVKTRLAAAGHIARIESTYWWNGQLEHQPEARATFHTTPAMLDAIQATVTELHPYEVPSIFAIALINPPETYVRWLVAQLDVDV